MKTFIYCLGSHGRVVLDILLRSLNREFIGFVDDCDLTSKYRREYNIYSFDQLLEQDPKDVEIIIANGNPRVREKIYSKIYKYNFNFINAIDRSANISSSAILGIDNTIGINCIVNTNADIGDHCIINNGSVIEHDSTIEDFSTICPGVQIGGKSKIKRGSFICTGAIVLPHIEVGVSSVVAAGSIVTKNVPDKTLVMGSPARVICDVDDNFNWQKLL